MLLNILFSTLRTVCFMPVLSFYDIEKDMPPCLVQVFIIS